MTDPDALARLRAEFPRPHEAVAAWTVERVLGALVRRMDRAGAPPGTVDGEIVYPDGHTAAVEFTSVEATEVWHLGGLIDGMKPTPAPGRLGWSIFPRSADDFEQLARIYERVIIVCEAHGVTDPARLPHEVIAADADLRWLAWETRANMFGFDHDPVVRWMRPAIVGAVAEGEAAAAEISATLAAVLREPLCVRHIDKLIRATHDERHLFLSVGLTGLSHPAAWELMDPEVVPDLDPDLPDGLGHLWLASDWGKAATVWSRGWGWRIERLAV